MMFRVKARSVVRVAAVATVLASVAARVQGGVVSNWAFEGNVTSSTGTYDATAFNAPAYAAGVIGQAISLNGIDQYATVPAMGTYANAAVSVWVKT